MKKILFLLLFLSLAYSLKVSQIDGPSGPIYAGTTYSYTYNFETNLAANYNISINISNTTQKGEFKLTSQNKTCEEGSPGNFLCNNFAQNGQNEVKLHFTPSINLIPGSYPLNVLFHIHYNKPSSTGGTSYNPSGGVSFAPTHAPEPTKKPKIEKNDTKPKQNTTKTKNDTKESPKQPKNKTEPKNDTKEQEKPKKKDEAEILEVVPTKEPKNEQKGWPLSEILLYLIAIFVLTYAFYKLYTRWKERGN